jgi:hypothetical protein
VKLTPRMVARIDQDLAAAQFDLDCALAVYLSVLAATEDDIAAMIAASDFLRGAPQDALAGMVIAALHRMTPPSH